MSALVYVWRSEDSLGEGIESFLLWGFREPCRSLGSVASTVTQRAVSSLSFVFRFCFIYLFFYGYNNCIWNSNLCELNNVFLDTTL